jgi:hypothetical protein
MTAKDTDSAMLTFLATVDPVEVEQERLGPPPWHERPGGSQWKAMQVEHHMQVERWHVERARRAGAHHLALAAQEAAAYDKRRRDREYKDYLREARARRRVEQQVRREAS